MTRHLIISMSLVVLAVSFCQANDDFVAHMNSRVGTWKHEGEQTGLEKFKWSTTEKVTRKGAGLSRRWESEQRIVFADGVVRKDIMTFRQLRGGGWTTEGTYGKKWNYSNRKMKIQGRPGYGRWSTSNKKIVETYRGEIATTTMLGPKRWRLVATTPDGTKTVIIARKVR